MMDSLCRKRKLADSFIPCDNGKAKDTGGIISISFDPFCCWCTFGCHCFGHREPIREWESEFVYSGPGRLF